nr:hypothetical protein [Bifidobacterium pullorum]
MVFILRIIQGIDGPVLNADAVEQTHRVGVTYGHRAVVGINVIVTHRNEGCRNLHRNGVTRRKVVALGDRYLDFRKIRAFRVGSIHTMVIGALVDNTGERPNSAVFVRRALMKSVSEREIHLVVVRTHTRDFHEGTERVGKGQVARGTRGALHLFNRRTGALIDGERFSDVLEDLLESHRIGCGVVVLRRFFAVFSLNLIAEVQVTEVARLLSPPVSTFGLRVVAGNGIHVAIEVAARIRRICIFKHTDGIDERTALLHIVCIIDCICCNRAIPTGKAIRFTIRKEDDDLLSAFAGTGQTAITIQHALGLRKTIIGPCRTGRVQRVDCKLEIRNGLSRIRPQIGYNLRVVVCIPVVTIFVVTNLI